MINWKAIRVGLNLRIKGLAGLPYRSLVQKSWEMSAEEFWNYQASAFKRIYHFSRNRIPFYQKRSDIYPPMLSNQENILEFLAKLPILRKQTVREYNSEFWPSPMLPLTKFHTTSGTSGTPLKLSATIWEKGFEHAVLGSWFLRICGTRNPRNLMELSGFMTPSANKKELYWRDPIFSGHIHLSIYSLNSTNRIKIADLINRFRPNMIHGYASGIHQLALTLGDCCANTKYERVCAASCEVLHPDWCTAIEANLCSKLYDYYGSQEGCHRVFQCGCGRMHIDPLVGIVEIVDQQGKPANPGEIGRVLVTGLVRKSMPLFRYELGDRAESTGYASDCECGLQWPTMGYVEGRSEDLVKTRDGRKIGYLCFHAAKDLKGIKEAQIVQEGYEQYRCNLVIADSEQVAKEHLETKIREQLVKRLQMQVNIHFNYVQSIPRGPNGKFKAVVVNFTEGQQP